MQLKVLKEYRLAGGTGLSLQLGHRKSVDIDLFSETYCDGTKLKGLLLPLLLFPNIIFKDTPYRPKTVFSIDFLSLFVSTSIIRYSYLVNFHFRNT